MEVIKRIFDGVPDEEVRRMTSGNTLEPYHIDVTKLPNGACK